MRAIAAIVLSIILLTACSIKNGEGSSAEAADGNLYAKGFRIEKHKDFTLLEVSDPWQDSHDVLYRYILSDKPELIPDSLGNFSQVKTPVQRCVVLSTTHVAMLEELNLEHTIVGTSGCNYIYSSGARERISSGDIKEVGYGVQLDYEGIVAMNPDVLFLYGVEGNVVSVLEKLKDLGIPAVFCGEYLEEHPLGKAEWLRYFSVFFEMEEKADSLFSAVDSAYNYLRTRIPSRARHPKILSGLPWKDVWYMAGGKSYAAKLISDAGGDYLWKETRTSQALPLNLESVYQRAVEADIWINPGVARSLDDIVKADARFSHLSVVRSGRIYNNDVRMSGGGGNDYWESGTVRPDLILGDLIYLFHPNLLPDHSPVYYRQLK